MTQTLEFRPGSHVSKAADDLVAAAKESGQPAHGVFNGITLTANPDSNAQQVLAAWESACEERRLAYEASPEGIAARKKAEDVRTALQARHDALMAALPHLDWNSDVAVLDWCCDMQEPSDHNGVNRQRQEMIDTFKAHGFLPGVNCGPDFKDGDRDNMVRYIIGQALSGPSIHGIIHKFAAEWKDRFGLARVGRQ